MTEIIIFLEDIDPVVFFGTNNSLLDKIRSFFPKIKIMARGNEIKCMGEETEIMIFAEKFNELLKRYPLPQPRIMVSMFGFSVN